MGKGHVLKALQNEHYCSPCSLPDDRCDAWTGLLTAATAGLIQGNPRPWMLRPAMPAWRARSQGKAAGCQGTTSVPNPLCPIPQAAHYVSCVGPVEGWCPHWAQGFPPNTRKNGVHLQHGAGCGTSAAAQQVFPPTSQQLCRGPFPSAGLCLPSSCSGYCNQHTLLWACFINLLLGSCQHGWVLLLPGGELSSVLTPGDAAAGLSTASLMGPCPASPAWHPGCCATPLLGPSPSCQGLL